MLFNPLRQISLCPLGTLYYLTTFTKNGTRRTKTFRTYEEALVACYPGLTVKLAAYLGLRRSEIAGLRWQCVDLKANIVVYYNHRPGCCGQPVHVSK